jgi:hypothetical protein
MRARLEPFLRAQRTTLDHFLGWPRVGRLRPSTLSSGALSTRGAELSTATCFLSY